MPPPCSRPSATRKIYLDFDGHITTGTKWNREYQQSVSGSFTTPAFDLDGNPAAFSDSERADIVAMWRAVSEDYVAFDVDATTEDPGGGLWEWLDGLLVSSRAVHTS